MGKKSQAWTIIIFVVKMNEKDKKSKRNKSEGKVRM